MKLKDRMAPPWLVLLFGLAASPALADEPAPAAPGAGVMCVLGVEVAAAEVGRRCFKDQDPALQVELGRAVARLEDYVLENGPPSPEDLARVTASRNLARLPDAKLCQGDVAPLYLTLRAAGPERLRSETDHLEARRGTPTWGDCQ